MKVFDMSTLDDLKPKVRAVEVQGTQFYVQAMSAQAQALYNAQGTRMAPLQKIVDDPTMKVPTQKEGSAIANEYADIMLSMTRIALMNGIVDEDGNKIIKTANQFARVYETLSPDVIDDLVMHITTQALDSEEKKESGE